MPACVIHETSDQRDYYIEGRLADGSLRRFRERFSQELQHGIAGELAQEADDGLIYLGDWQKGEIQIIGVAKIIANRYWTEVVYHVLFPPRREGDGPAEGTYRNIRWNSGLRCGAGALIVTTSGDIVLLRSFRHAKRAWTLELPRGIRYQSETLEACAEREGREEVGMVRLPTTKVVGLGVHDPDTGIVAQEAEIFAFVGAEIDETKVDRDISESTLGPVIVSARRFMEMIRDGEVTDGWACSAFGKAMAHGLLSL